MFFRSLFLLLKAFGKMYDFRRLSLMLAYITTISEDFHSLEHSTTTISEDFHSLEHSTTTISEAFERCYDDTS